MKLQNQNQRVSRSLTKGEARFAAMIKLTRLGIAVHARREQSKHVRRRLLTTKRLAEVFDFFFVKVCGTQFCFSRKTARKRLPKIFL